MIPPENCSFVPAVTKALLKENLYIFLSFLHIGLSNFHCVWPAWPGSWREASQLLPLVANRIFNALNGWIFPPFPGISRHPDCWRIHRAGTVLEQACVLPLPPSLKYSKRPSGPEAPPPFQGRPVFLNTISKRIHSRQSLCNTLSLTMSFANHSNWFAQIKPQISLWFIASTQQGKHLFPCWRGNLVLFCFFSVKGYFGNHEAQPTACELLCKSVWLSGGLSLLWMEKSKFRKGVAFYM